MQHEIIPPNLAITSMRSSGYRDTAHAIAELIDNSIQSGVDVNECTNVEILCVDKIDTTKNRRRQRIDRIAVYDNANGMDQEMLRIALQFGNGSHLMTSAQNGIGKFGMGLPNASISQCCRVEVWSWQNGQCHYTYLDIEEIKSGELREVPIPVQKTIPEYWKSLIRDRIGDHGTLVVWSGLDRVRWKTSSAFLRNTEFLVGRMYRYFLKDKKAVIRLAAFEDHSGSITAKGDQNAVPNDPLYLMTGTVDPMPYKREPAFDEFAKYSTTVKVNDEEHLVKLTFTCVKKKARHEGGGTTIGKNALKNQGVSVVRAGRELEVNSTFDNTYDPRERWWGVEVSFEPALDDVFGVSNNKQAATAFRNMSLDDDAATEDLSPQAYREMLEDSNDPRLAIYEISKEINNQLTTIRAQIKALGEGKKKKNEITPQLGSAEEIATRATLLRRQEQGIVGKSDEEEKNLSIEAKERVLTEEFTDEVTTEEEAKEIAVEWARTDMKFVFKEESVPGPVIFDIRSRAGLIFVIVNSDHPANEGLFELLKDDDDINDTPALRSLKLLLEAWARLEDEADTRRRQSLEDIRLDWGRIARDFLQEIEG